MFLKIEVVVLLAVSLIPDTFSPFSYVLLIYKFIHLLTLTINSTCLYYL